MKKQAPNPIYKTAVMKKTKGMGGVNHPMARLSKAAPKKAMLHASRKGTLKSGKG